MPVWLLPAIDNKNTGTPLFSGIFHGMRNIVRKILFAVLAVGMLPVSVAGQQVASDSVQSPFDWHLKLGTEFLSFNRHSEVLTFVAPSFSFKVSPGIRINAGFSYLSDFSGLNLMTPDLAPRRSGTRVCSLYAQAEYLKNDRFWFRGTMFYSGGNIGFLNRFSSKNMQNNLCVYGASADFGFRIFDDASVRVRFSFIRDERGTLPPFFADYMMFRNSYSPAFDFDILADPYAFPMGF